MASDRDVGTSCMWRQLGSGYQWLANRPKKIGRGVGLIGIAVFMLWVRVQNVAAFYQGPSSVRFPSPDAWYHKRTTMYTVEHFPNTIPFDPYTAFDTGNHAGQFGTIFDQFLAGIALIAGLGHPSEAVVNAVLIYAPPVLGILTLLPVYLLATRIETPLAGIGSALLLAISSGTFLQRSVAGFADHHVAETLLTATFLYCLHQAFLTQAQRDPSKPEWNLDSQWVKWAVTAGFVLAAYLLLWPPGVFVLGILGVFMPIQAISTLRGTRPIRDLADPVIIACTTASLVFLPWVRTWTLGVTEYSALQPLSLLIIVCAAIIIRYGSSHSWVQKSPLSSSVLVAGVLAGIGFSIKTFLPAKWGFLIHNIGRVVWFIDTTQGTIAEAGGIQYPVGFAVVTYGFGIVLSIGALLWAVKREIEAPGGNPGVVLIATYTVCCTSATLSQIRFDYYLVIGIAVLTGIGVSRIHHSIRSIATTRGLGDVDLRAAFVTVLVLGLLVGPVIGAGIPVTKSDQYSAVSEENAWGSALDWLSTETPAVGEYGIDTTHSELDYQGRVAEREDFPYEDGMYGVLTRWSAGHRITVQANRIPVSNPHQQHARSAADIFLSPTESDAMQRMDAKFGEGSGIRYLVIDHAMASGESPIFTSAASYSSIVDSEAELGKQIIAENGSVTQILQSPRSYRSLRTRLYQFHGSAVRKTPLVVHTETQQSGTEIGFENSPSASIKVLDSGVEASRQASQQGIVHGGLFAASPIQLDAIQHFRLVYATPSEITVSNPLLSEENRSVSEVKIFERVPGASVSGYGPANSTIVLSVTLRVESTGDTFEYKQFIRTGSDGAFSTTVPYATTGAGEIGVSEGVADSEVTAIGPYEASVGGTSTEFDVPERAVVDEFEPIRICIDTADCG